MNRLSFFLGCALAFALAGFFLMFGTSGGAVGVGTGEQTVGKRQQQTAEGQCAARRSDGEIVGRVIGQQGPTRGAPQMRYVVEEFGRRRVIQVYAGEVRRVPCASLPEGAR